MYTSKNICFSSTYTHSFLKSLTSSCHGYAQAETGQHCLMLRDSALMTQLEQLLSTTVIYFLHLAFGALTTTTAPFHHLAAPPTSPQHPICSCQHRLQHTNLTDGYDNLTPFPPTALFATITPLDPFLLLFWSEFITVITSLVLCSGH